MFTIDSLPPKLMKNDLKALIKRKCKINDVVVNTFSSKVGQRKVKVCVIDDEDGQRLMECLNGYNLFGHFLRITPYGKSHSDNEIRNSLNYNISENNLQRDTNNMPNNGVDGNLQWETMHPINANNFSDHSVTTMSQELIYTTNETKCQEHDEFSNQFFIESIDKNQCNVQTSQMTYPYTTSNYDCDYTADALVQTMNRNSLYETQQSDLQDLKGGISNNNDHEINVGICDVKPMNDLRIRLLHKVLNKAIMNSSRKGKGPKFIKITNQPGWVHITCQNDKSRQWLLQNVKLLKPWAHSKLSVVPESSFFKNLIGTLHVPFSEVNTLEDVIKLLRAQNEGLNTRLWKILYKGVDKNTLVIKLAIDKASAQAVRAMGNKVALGLKMLKFKIKGDIDTLPDIFNREHLSNKKRKQLLRTLT